MKRKLTEHVNISCHMVQCKEGKTMTLCPKRQTHFLYLKLQNAVCFSFKKIPNIMTVEIFMSLFHFAKLHTQKMYVKRTYGLSVCLT